MHFAVIEKILTRGHARRSPLRLQVHQEQLRLRPSLLDLDQQPAAIAGNRNLRPILGIAALAKNRIVVDRFVAQFVIKHVPVIHLLPGRDFARRRILGVIKPAVIRQPRNRSRPRSLDRVGKNRSRSRLDHVQRAHLRSARRSSVRHILPVLARLKPIERDRAIRRKRVRIHQHAVLAIRRIAHVKHRLVLHALAPRIEIMFPGNHRRRHAANGQQLRQPFVDRLPTRQRIEHHPRVRIFFRDPLLRLGALCVLEPAVVIDDRRPMKNIGHGLDLRRGRFRIVCGKHGCRQKEREKSQSHHQPSTPCHRNLTTCGLGCDLQRS